jgi:hypothetical protein
MKVKRFEYYSENFMLVTTMNVLEESLCIDESVIPFIGRLTFRQCLKNKRHRYGVKIFKLCVHDGLVYS